ncbi:2'-5' RNA ligase family protein [Virgibacillus kekensis]|uniref:2'-5' RNA ligase family protein n=1 Tax=Virgibacillus kekensis TaxID=202261 RepID=A0ABV9DKA1_9BACI
MQYFLGIVPSEEHKLKIDEFRQNWQTNSISDIVEPHITLKAQGGLTPDKSWLCKVEHVCFNFNPFQIALNKPMFFGDDILYLSAKSDDLYTLHNRIVKEVSPPEALIKKYFELDDFVPHMTLGKTAYGLTKQELKDMAVAAEKELNPYPILEVNFVRVYQEYEVNRYKKLLDVPLGQANR